MFVSVAATAATAVAAAGQSLSSAAAAAVAAAAACDNLSSLFPAPLDGLECWGLSPNATGPMGNPITDEAGCASLCCASASCTLYNFNSTDVGPPPGAVVGCWTGTLPLKSYTCRPIAAWVGRGGRGEPPPPPPPAPCPTSPVNGSLGLCLGPSPPVQPLPFAPGANVTLGTVGADARSLLRASPRDQPGAPLRRWFPVSGEIHVGRVPRSEWKEQLMRMRSGGLDMVAVYVFWCVRARTWEERR